DFLRPIIIGIAPFVGGLLTLWLVIQSKLFPGRELWQTLVFGYFIIAVSVNMFSSRQDLIDVAYLIPIVLIILFLLYLFPIHISSTFINQLFIHISYFITVIQVPLLFSLGIHAILIVLLTKFE
ncbi:MAG: hypothetical protein NTV98_05445, partial [Candidatus Roizmanbacteria bacterium]|nr:hypothetical protein [Candidatus Roizmanbacteria bacterium]